MSQIIHHKTILITPPSLSLSLSLSLSIYMYIAIKGAEAQISFPLWPNRSACSDEVVWVLNVDRLMKGQTIGRTPSL